MDLYWNWLLYLIVRSNDGPGGQLCLGLCPGHHRQSPFVALAGTRRRQGRRLQQRQRTRGRIGAQHGTTASLLRGGGKEIGETTGNVEIETRVPDPMEFLAQCLRDTQRAADQITHKMILKKQK